MAHVVIKNALHQLFSSKFVSTSMKPGIILLPEAVGTQENLHPPDRNAEANQDGSDNSSLALITEEYDTHDAVVAVAQQEIPVPPLRKQFFQWRTLLSLLVVLVVGLFIVQQFHFALSPTRIIAVLPKANLLLALAALLAFYVSLLVRALRWKMLLEQVGYQKSQGGHTIPW